MSYKLVKLYTDKEKSDFIVEYNHKLGLKIEETEKALYALEPYEILQGDEVIDNSEEYQKEQAQKKAERIAMLKLTRGDVFRGLLLAKGITREQLRLQLESMPATTQEDIVKRELALIDFDEALDFYRGNSLIDTVGLALGLTTEQLDKFFDTKDYHYLTTCKLTINATPAEATVTGDGSYPYGDVAHYKIECGSYVTQEGDIEMVKNEVLEVVLDEDTGDNNTSGKVI